MRVKLDNQLKTLREEMHNRYLVKRGGNIHPINNIHPIKTDLVHEEIIRNRGKQNSNTNEKWPPNTILITGVSMINQLDEQRLSNSVNGCIKVRSFPGANIENMYNYLSPLLENEPKVIVLHNGTNDVVMKSSDIILNEISKLKLHFESKLSGANVIISCPAMRIDNCKARLTIKHLISKIKHMKVKYMLNNNISENCLGRKGLHLNPRGTGRLVVNLISLIRKL